jgi:hypothetical protein
VTNADRRSGRIGAQSATPPLDHVGQPPLPRGVRQSRKSFLVLFSKKNKEKQSLLFEKKK